MKKVYLFLTFLLTLALNACVTDVDEDFDRDTAERLDEWVKECKTVLTSSEKGWIMEFYPSSSRAYGGFILLVKFMEDGSVHVSSELAGNSSDVVTSHYSVIPYTAATLSFDTYNEFLHYFSDPDSGDEVSGKAMGGDFQFAYYGTEGDKVTLRGIKTSNAIILKKFPVDATWEAYLKSIQVLHKEVKDKLYEGFVMKYGEEKLVLKPDDDYRVFYYTSFNNIYDQDKFSYLSTLTGISLYTPFKWQDITMQNFEWDGMKYVSTDAVNASGQSVTVTLEGYYSENFVHYNDLIGEWKLTYRTGLTDDPIDMPVKLTKKEYGSTFNLSGLSDYDVEIKYVKSTASMSMLFQYLGLDGNGKSVYLCPYSQDGYYSWMSGAGFSLKRDNKSLPMEYYFHDNKAWDKGSKGILLYRFSGSPSGSTGVGTLKKYAILDKMTKN